MTIFDPYAYRITVQRIEVEGATYFSGSVKELPDAEVFEESPQEAYEGMAQLISDLKAAADEEKRSFPLPIQNSSNASGRVTLRLPKWLHADLELESAMQEISLNTHLVTLLAEANARLHSPMARFPIVVSPILSNAPSLHKTAVLYHSTPTTHSSRIDHITAEMSPYPIHVATSPGRHVAKRSTRNTTSVIPLFGVANV